jgi:hypothetical protein
MKLNQLLDSLETQLSTDDGGDVEIELNGVLYQVEEVVGTCRGVRLIALDKFEEERRDRQREDEEDADV